MIGKFVVALLAAPFLASATDAPQPLYADVEQVRQVLCDTARGTAFRVGSGAFVSARHVTHGRVCTIDGEAIQVTWESAELDMVVMRTKVYGKGLPIDCGGYKDGEPYAAVGFARGEPRQRVIFTLFMADLDAKLPRWMKFRTLFGDRFIPGMSGGINVNRAGKVVGIVNGYQTDAPLSYSLPLSDTPLCGAQA
jgi:hypothetical protein